MGVDPSEAWPAVVAGILTTPDSPVTTRVIAADGWTVVELLEAIDEAAPSGPFRAVTIGAGVNDQYRGLPLDRYERDSGRMITRAIDLAGGDPARVVTLSIPDWSVTPHAADRDRSAVAAGIDQFNAAARAAAETAGTAWVDLTASSRLARDDPGLLADDGLHPSARLHTLWAGLIAGPLGRALS